MRPTTAGKRWYHGRCHVQGTMCENHGREVLALNLVEAREKIGPWWNGLGGKGARVHDAQHGQVEILKGRLPR